MTRPARTPEHPPILPRARRGRDLLNALRRDAGDLGQRPHRTPRRDRIADSLRPRDLGGHPPARSVQQMRAGEHLGIRRRHLDHGLHANDPAHREGDAANHAHLIAPSRAGLSEHGLHPRRHDHLSGANLVNAFYRFNEHERLLSRAGG